MTHRFTAQELRLMAEAADGMRGEDLVLISKNRDDGSGVVLDVIPEKDLDSALHKELLKCRTDLKVGNPPTIEHIKIKAKDNQKEESLLDRCDALFWTESAVEKFVIPYYVGVLGLHSTVEVWRAFDDPKVYALAHLPRSVMEPLGVVNDKGVETVQIETLKHFLAR